MNRTLVAIALLFCAQSVWAAEPNSTQSEPRTKATFSISGLHCPPCTSTVASGIKKLKGVKTAKVDWGTKSAQVEFDESALSAQQIANAVAATPHMMGAGLQYGSWLALSVPAVVDDASAQKAEAAVRDIKGVAKASASSKRHTLSVQFASEGTVSSRQLIEALDQAGFKAANY